MYLDSRKGEFMSIIILDIITVRDNVHRVAKS